MRMEPAAEKQHSKNSLSQQSVGTAALFKKKKKKKENKESLKVSFTELFYWSCVCLTAQPTI